ncbi:Zeaxanthin epoxidase, chloroplastic [Planktothrix tepida]|uniref:Zeaxanthin epoxidase n=1 Tax=Planktothrix tepida PCC 9214 TaxID=671072 RepID=A0A1J1LIG6_9CYAN|nr:FAD-dependent monooxygenase [Planktothrix tepida]CAD5927498.1 Zeaxanthin epoxidase, chloroplastic [Planktothrix tepida]CUR31361.1 Zeaxanthin epoxidase [Planktothrix tepida PCC 9214]
MASEFKVIIIGGGMGGLTLAHACLHQGISVELYDKRDLKAMLSGPGGIFIQHNALRVYKLLNSGQLSQRFYQQGGKILKGGFFSQTGDPLYINSPEFIREDDLGVCLLRPELQQILYETLPPEIVHPGVAFENFEDIGNQVRVSFSDGSTVEGDILVGADGLYSKVRARLQDQERLEEPVYSGTCCWRGYFNTSSLSLDSRYSWAEFWGQGHRFGYFDVGGGRFAFYAFNNTSAGGNDDAVGGSLKALRSIFQDYAEPIPAIIDALDPEKIYRDDIVDRAPLGSQWGQGRVTLIGDAAHPVLPTLGQGGCMAVEDGFELAKQLSVHTGSADNVSELLREFEAHRSQRVTRVFNTSRQIATLAQADTAIGCWLRNWIYKLTPTRLADLQFKWLFDYQPKP